MRYVYAARERLPFVMLVGSILFLLAIITGQVPVAKAQEQGSVSTTRADVIEVDVSQIYFTDGDTIRYLKVSYRLMGFDAPETFRSKCDSEMALGLKAKEHLMTIVRAAKTVTLMLGRRDKYGRTLATLLVDGKDVGPIMIEAGFAVEYHGRGPRKNWCPEVQKEG